MLNSRFSFKQVQGFERAKYQYQIARKLGTARSNALDAAVAAYVLVTGEGRESSRERVSTYLATQPEIPGGTL